MTTEIKKEGAQIMIILNGSLDIVNATEFMNAIKEIQEAMEPNIVIDCQAMNYISSSGLRAFNILQKKVTKNKGILVIQNLKPEVKKIFELTGFSKIITIE